MLIDQYTSGAIARGEARVENQYSRVVRDGGNPAALRLLNRVFATRDTFEWRGLGWMPYSGMGISEEFAALGRRAVI
ncbi:Hydrogenase expression/formation protein hypD [Mobiluncus curtisii]|uniref:Hydrogenase expression/formation protein hypD n=1 Tax=Mobiluncus curtisii TaxID=2051 RepID=A0A2X3C261_9ACTO|nr:Hydrogenase expression/formation protein hypD [Mobiluncus curtisii]